MNSPSPALQADTRTVAVMQPYLFPYLPYVQLLTGVNVFIIFDTAQYIARGWSNRNALFLAGRVHRFTIPVARHARVAPYRDIRFTDDLDRDVHRLKQTVANAMRPLPFREAALRLIDDTFPAGDPPDFRFVEAFERMARSILALFGAKTELVRASTLMDRGDSGAQEYIIHLVSAVNGKTYVNPIGGTLLYDDKAFAAQGVELRFLRTLLNDGATGSALPNSSLSILQHFAQYSMPVLSSYLTRYRLLSRSEATSLHASN